mgnify:CR=1 FL=1
MKKLDYISQDDVNHRLEQMKTLKREGKPHKNKHHVLLFKEEENHTS